VDVGDSWTPIDFGQKPAHRMVPLQRGTKADLTEIPANG
jgi:hypothetical protein